MDMLTGERDGMEADLHEMEAKAKAATDELQDVNSSLQEALSERDLLRDQLWQVTEEKETILGEQRLLVDELECERDRLTEVVESQQGQMSKSE